VLGLEPKIRRPFCRSHFCMKEAADIQDQMAKFQKLDEARDWFLRVLSADLRSRDANYSLGVIDWSIAAISKMQSNGSRGRSQRKREWYLLRSLPLSRP
jgi:hypothetical protein